MPLIFSRSLEVTGVTIEKPVINLVRKPSGTWNFSTLGAALLLVRRPLHRGGSNSVSVDKLTIHGGKLSVTDADTGGKAREYDQVEVQVSDFSQTSQFPFQFSMQTPGSGTVKISGKAGPLNPGNLEATPLDASLDVHNLDLAATGFVDAASGISGHLDFTGSLNGDGKQVQSKGNVTASKLQLVPGSAPATQPVKLDYAVTLQMQPQTGALSQGDVHIGKALAHLTGTFNAAGKTPALEMRLNGDAMPLSDLQAVLPAMNVALPSGASMSAGTMTVNLSIAGPSDRLVISGPVNLSNATLAGYDMGSKLGALGPFAGVKKSPNTTIQTFSTDLRVAGGVTNADKINLVVDGIGTITGKRHGGRRPISELQDVGGAERRRDGGNHQDSRRRQTGRRHSVQHPRHYL